MKCNLAKYACNLAQNHDYILFKNNRFCTIFHAKNLLKNLRFAQYSQYKFYKKKVQKNF